MSLSDTSFSPLYTKSKSWRHGRSCRRFSGGCLLNNFCISTNTSNALTKSGFSECKALVILDIQRMRTLRYCLSAIERSEAKSSGIASALKSCRRHMSEEVNSFALSNLLTSRCDSWVSSFWHSLSCYCWSDSLSMSSFSKLNALNKNVSNDL